MADNDSRFVLLWLGEVFASVESVKAAGSVYAPADLEITSVNSKLGDNSGLINESPFEKGYLVKVLRLPLVRELLLSKDLIEPSFRRPS